MLKGNASINWYRLRLFAYSEPNPNLTTSALPVLRELSVLGLESWCPALLRQLQNLLRASVLNGQTESDGISASGSLLQTDPTTVATAYVAGLE